MATINISDLRPTGSELFSDSESYMNELNENERANINGGAISTPVCAIALSVAIRVSAQSSYKCAVAITIITRPR